MMKKQLTEIISEMDFKIYLLNSVFFFENVRCV